MVGEATAAAAAAEDGEEGELEEEVGEKPGSTPALALIRRPKGPQARRLVSSHTARSCRSHLAARAASTAGSASSPGLAPGAYLLHVTGHRHRHRRRTDM